MQAWTDPGKPFGLHAAHHIERFSRILQRLSMLKGERNVNVSKITRRVLLNRLAFLGASPLFTGKTTGQTKPTSLPRSAQRYREPEKEIPVYGHFDVIAVGGGPAGFAAALASARNGARTLILERFPYFGGTATASLMPNINGYRNQVKPDGLQTSKGIAEEVILRLKEVDGLGKTGYKAEAYPTVKGQLSYSYGIDPEKFKYITLKMIHEAGIRVLFHTLFVDSILEGNRITGVIFENKSGRQAAFGKVVVDATGDADVAHRTGAPYWKADPEKDKALRCALMYKVAGFGPNDFEQLAGPCTRQAKVFWGPASPPLDAVDADALTRGEMETRLGVYDDFKKKQEQFPFLKNASIVETPPLLGIRQTRFIDGLYQITGDDALAGRTFEDSIAMSSCPIISYYGYRRYLEHEGYEIPYRCLLPRNVEGLLVTGRCISTDQRAFESQRAMAPTMCLGEAAGTSAALCAKQGKTPKEMEVKQLQRQLVQQGAEIGQNKKG